MIAKNLTNIRNFFSAFVFSMRLFKTGGSLDPLVILINCTIILFLFFILMKKGWNIAYEFTNEDLAVCKKQLKLLLDDYLDIPYKVLNYLGAEINYGGRVTDDKDIRLIKSILSVYCCKDVIRDG